MFRRDKRTMIGYYRPCDLLTMFGTVCGISAVIFALTGKSAVAVVALILAGICDGFDGMLARKGKYDKVQTTYGIELDSLSDVISFGIAPAFITLSIVGFNHTSTVLIAIFYIMASLIRLAYFNTLELNGLSQKGCFKGVPVTFISIAYPIIYFSSYLFEFIYLDLVLTIALFIIGISYLVPISVKKFSNQSRFIFAILGVILIILFVLKMIF